jgi:hypothetical protein
MPCQPLKKDGPVELKNLRRKTIELVIEGEEILKKVFKVKDLHKNCKDMEVQTGRLNAEDSRKPKSKFDCTCNAAYASTADIKKVLQILRNKLLGVLDTVGKMTNSAKAIGPGPGPEQYTEDKYPYAAWQNKLRRPTKKNPKKPAQGNQGRDARMAHTDTEAERRFHVPAGDMGGYGHTDGSSYRGDGGGRGDPDGFGLDRNLGVDDIDYLLKQRNYLLNNPTMGGDSSGGQVGDIVTKLDLILSRLAGDPGKTDNIFATGSKSQGGGGNQFSASNRS